MKKICCIINAILAFVAFCVIFGYFCYLRGVYSSARWDGGIFYIAYYLIVTCVAIGLIHIHYYTKKVFIFSAVFASSIILFTRLLNFLSDGVVLGGIWNVLTVLSLVISAIYMIAAFVKDKR